MRSRIGEVVGNLNQRWCKVIKERGACNNGLIEGTHPPDKSLLLSFSIYKFKTTVCNSI
jgi:hypothetical protein